MTAVNPTSGFNTDDLEWMRFTADPRFDYPIGYDIAVLGYHEQTDRLDVLIRWHPGSYCHFHRHICATTTLVLEGEHHVIDVDEDGNEVARDIRPVGTYRNAPAGDLHMEQGGPDGSLVLFVIQEPSGQLFEVLDADRNVLAVTTTEYLLEAIAS